MKLFGNNKETITCELTHDEIRMLMACTREIGAGVHFHAFETRIGFQRESVVALAKSIHELMAEAGIEE